MADSLLRIEGIHPTIDGEYPLVLTGFTNRDWNDIKRIAKVRPRELKEAFEQADTDLFVAFAVIALRHAGKPVAEDMLWDAPLGKLSLRDGDEEEVVDDLPPTSAPSNAPQSEPDAGAKPNEPSATSGLDSRNGSDHQGNGLSPTGSPLSGTGAMSPSET